MLDPLFSHRAISVTSCMTSSGEKRAQDGKHSPMRGINHCSTNRGEGFENDPNFVPLLITVRPCPDERDEAICPGFLKEQRHCTLENGHTVSAEIVGYESLDKNPKKRGELKRSQQTLANVHHCMDS